jgi:hypothetical protein
MHPDKLGKTPACSHPGRRETVEDPVTARIQQNSGAASILYLPLSGQVVGNVYKPNHQIDWSVAG